MRWWASHGRVRVTLAASSSTAPGQPFSEHANLMFDKMSERGNLTRTEKM
jgi:hypothetical protein